MRERRYSYTILDLDTGWGEWSASRPSCFTPRKGSRNPLHRRLGGPQSRSGRCEVQKYISCPCREPNPSCPSLYRPSYPGSRELSNRKQKLSTVDTLQLSVHLTSCLGLLDTRSVELRSDTIHHKNMR
jgi:hypothetical protein